MEFFINMSYIPKNGDPGYDDFFQRELEKIRYGVTIDGVYIHGWLYWHLNHWKIMMDAIDPNSNEIVRKFTNPSLRDNEWLIATHLKQAEDEKKGLCIVGTRRFSKALRDDSTIFTESGPKLIKDAIIGDKIYGRDGKLTTITEVSPQGIKDIYKLTFRDGREVFCCEDHLWTFYTKKTEKLNRKGLKQVTLNTKTLFNSYYTLRKNSHKPGEVVKEYKYFLPKTEPVNFSQKELPIDPYFLGLWLGDGNSLKPSITTIDSEIKEYIYDYANSLNLTIRKEDITYHLTTGVQGGRTSNILINKLRSLNLLKNKHIPDIYLYSSIEQRLELLKGLIDTDGMLSKNGAYSFATSNERLKDDVLFLCRSLGINCTSAKYKAGYKREGIYKETKDCYNISIFTDLTLSKLPRKTRTNKLNKNHYSRINKTTLVNIELVEKESATCIMVDNEDKLFLTDNFVPTHNSVFESSYIARSATIFEGSENVIVGNNKDDLGVITSLCDKGLNALHEYFRFGRINDDWKKEVSLGFKDKKGRREEWSKIFIRNTDGGTETEVVAGTTPKALILDEAGKAKFLEVFAAATPAFASPYGWRAVPIIVGTGGDMQNGKDLEKMFNDPDTYNMVSTILQDEGGRQTCIFVPGTYALEFPKVKTTLGDYLNVENKDSELYLIDFYYSDHEINKEIILKKREELMKAKDSKELLKYKMYYPLTSDECFLTETGNNFPIESAKITLDLIMRKPELQGTPTRLYRGVDGKVMAERDNKRHFIWDYPHTPGANLNAPIMIWEPPVKNPPLYLYIAGIDPYNQNVSQTSESLGTCFIYKRMYDPIAGTFQNRIVASYSARPDTMKEWQENVELLLEYYNAIAMMENEGTTLLQYLDSKNKAHLLADGFSLLTEISPNTTIRNRPKGLPATLPVIRHCMNLTVEYCKEEIVLGYTEEGEPINALGIARITDPVLLKEFIQYRQGGNVDRIVAFRHILAFDKYLEKNHSVIRVGNEQKKELKLPSKTAGPFSMGGNPFGLKGRMFS